MSYCRECLHDEVCSLTHCGQSIACCDFVNAERYHEIMQAEREGRLVILPCKVGDSYYLVERFCTEGGYYDEKKQVSLGTCEWCSEECDRENRVVECRFNSAIDILMKERFFGKTVFLTREAAEKALEEANG